MADLYKITISCSEGFSTGTIILEDKEFYTMKKVFNAIKAKDKYSPVIDVINLSAIKREKEKQKRIQEYIRKENEELEKLEYKKDIMENGAIAKAFRAAMEKKEH